MPEVSPSRWAESPTDNLRKQRFGDGSKGSPIAANSWRMQWIHGYVHEIAYDCANLQHIAIWNGFRAVSVHLISIEHLYSPCIKVSDV